MKIEIVDKVTDTLFVALQNLMPQLTATVEFLNKESIRQIVESDNTYLLIALDDNEVIVGTLTVVVFTIPTSRKAFIEDVIVDANAQGLGAGRKLIEAGIALAKEKGAEKIELSSNPTRMAANALYQKVGFKIRDTNFYRLEL